MKKCSAVLLITVLTSTLNYSCEHLCEDEDEDEDDSNSKNQTEASLHKINSLRTSQID